MPILIDYSQLAISCAIVFPDDMQKGKNTKKMQDIIRHVTLKSLSTYLRDYRKYGELILCCDRGKSWRHDYFPYYKAHRAKNKAESNIDWETISAFVKELQEDLETVFPYPVVYAEKAEGDDCIAVLTKYFQTEENVESDNPMDLMTGEPPSVLIVSSDHDYKQLHKYPKVKQWSPMQKKWVEKADKEYIIDKIIGGDAGDGVPSVLMPDDWLVNGEGRAKPVTKAIREKYRNLESLNEEELQRYNRNKTLVDFDCIPKHIEERILDKYQEQKTRQRPKKQAIMDYFMKHRCRELLDRIGDF
jgi:hypothetical protein